MWKETLLVGFASVLLQTAEAQGGAESVSFHGFVPIENIRAKQPRGDNQPNDVYLHLEPKPILNADQDVFYPPTLVGFGLEYGQDPEQAVYQIYTKQEVEELKGRQQVHKKKHGKSFRSKGAHSKGGHSQEHSHPHPPPPPPPNHHHHPNEPHFQSSENHHSYNSHPNPPPQHPSSHPRFG